MFSTFFSHGTSLAFIAYVTPGPLPQLLRAGLHLACLLRRSAPLPGGPILHWCCVPSGCQRAGSILILRKHGFKFILRKQSSPHLHYTRHSAVAVSPLSYPVTPNPRFHAFLLPKRKVKRIAKLKYLVQTSMQSWYFHLYIILAMPIFFVNSFNTDVVQQSHRSPFHRTPYSTAPTSP